MANTIKRRPLPALVSLIALLALTGIVWWRVINRDTPSDAQPSKQAQPHSCTSSPVAPPTKTLSAPATVTVRVLNSTDRRGIASKARASLLAAGFKVPDDAGNDRSVSITATAQIRYGKSGADAARLVHFYFPGAQLSLRKKTTTATVTVTLGNAYKSVASARAVREAMAAKRVAIAPSAPSSAGASSTTSPSGRPSPSC